MRFQQTRNVKNFLSRRTANTKS